MEEHELQEVKVNLPESIAAGAYTNNMLVRHTREEFIMDFMVIAPPRGQVTARVITSPSHMKRIVDALVTNIEKYEEKFGEIPEVETPTVRIEAQAS